MSYKVLRKIDRPDAQVVSVLGDLGVATVHVAEGRVGLMRSSMGHIYPTARVSGPAVAVSCHPGDNLMIHAAIEVCQAGDVLLVVPTSESSDGMFGDLLAVSCRAHGIAGLIIDAGVRDTADLTVMQFPVWSKAVCAQGTVKASAGSVNVPIVCAGALVHPGDVVIGDADGVVVVPRASAAAAARLGEQRRAKEEKTRERLARGELGVDFYGLRAKLAELGVRYVDDASDEEPESGRGAAGR